MKARRPAAAMPGRASGIAISEEGAEPAMPVDAVGVLDVRADVLEIAAHDPQDQRQGDELVDPDQADIGVVEADVLEVEVERQEHQQRRREAEGQQREGDVLAEPELEAGEGVGGGHAKQKREQHRAGAEEEAVPEIAHELQLERAGRGDQPARDQRHVVLEGRLEEQRRRDAQDLLVRLERHQERPRRSGTGRTGRRGSAGRRGRCGRAGWCGAWVGSSRHARAPARAGAASS